MTVQEVEGKIKFDEQVCETFDFEKDFDREKFDYYLKLARISPVLSTESILENLRVLTPTGMTNAGILFFAKNPYKYILSSRIRCVLFWGNSRTEILDKKEVDYGIIGNIEYAANYVKLHVHVRYEINGIGRKEFPEFPEEAYREAVVNAVIHRDYFERGEIAVEKFADSISITNPGGLLASFPKNKFGTLHWPRNAILSDLLSKTMYMEKVGTGIQRIKEKCRENDNMVIVEPSHTQFFVSMESPAGWRDIDRLVKSEEKKEQINPKHEI